MYPRELARVERSGFVESRHLGVAVVCDAEAKVVAAIGDPATPVYPRSAVKPFQAIATARVLEAGAGPEPTAEARAVSLASASGSHAGEPVHVEAVRATLAAAGLDEGALRCPPALPRDPGDRAAAEAAGGPASIWHNCSGKHAWFLVAQAGLRGRRPGVPLAGYLDPGGPLQRAVTAELSGWTGVTPGHVGVDGCGAPTLVQPLAGLATAFARLAAGERDGAAELLAAVRQRPVLLGGRRALDTALVQATGGRVMAKVGAEAVYGAADLRSGRGLALKVLDGAARAAGPALLAVLGALGWLDEAELAQLEPMAAAPVTGGGRPVGAVRPAPGSVVTFEHG